jgi:ABC-type phosphate transport system substrate-binding protein
VVIAVRITRKEPPLKPKMKALAAGATLAASVALVSGAMLALPAGAAARTVLIGSGSSAEQPIMQLLFRSYSRTHRSVAFTYTPDGGNAGVKDVQSGRSQFAINTRPPLPSDSGTTQFKIFLDGLCLAVNPANSAVNISLTDAKNVFLGLTTSWSQIAGSNLTSTIDPVGRNSTAGSYTFFQSAVLGGKTQAQNVLPETSDGLVAQTIKNDHNSIGYVGLAHAGAGSGVKTLSLNGVACNQATIKSETYPLFRYIWGVVPSTSPSLAVEKFIDWVRTNHSAGQIINRAGAVAAFNK